MSREELVYIVKIFKNNGVDINTGIKLKERQAMDLMDVFWDNVSHPEGANLIFAPQDFGLLENASAEEIVDFALNYKEEI